MGPLFWWRNLKKQDRLLYICSLEDIIKIYVKDIKMRRCGNDFGGKCRDQCLFVLNTVMNLTFQ